MRTMRQMLREMTTVPLERAATVPLPRAATLPLQRAAVPLGIALVVAGCATLGGRGGEDGGGGVGWKMVMEKVPPSYVIAVDRSECTVSAERYAEIEVGKQAFCAWSARRDGTNRFLRSVRPD